MLDFGYYNMDCMEGMKEFPDKYFELCIVDPPYGIGNFVPQNIPKTGKRAGKKVIWNDRTPEEMYFTELIRVSKDQIIWGANYYNCFSKLGGAVIWNKGDSNPVFSQCEIASLSFQKRVDYICINWQSGFYRASLEKIIHPCQKPVKLYEWLLKNYAHKGDKILDTHVGSASSLIACHNLGFQYVGFELDKEYYEKSLDRLETAKKQVSILDVVGMKENTQIGMED